MVGYFHLFTTLQYAGPCLSPFNDLELAVSYTCSVMDCGVDQLPGFNTAIILRQLTPPII